MALDLRITYGSQVSSGAAGYPYGKAKNVLVEGDGSGTPFEANLVNDWIGFLQALLVNAAITPSGAPDSTLASDYLAAIQYATQHITGDMHVSHAISADFTIDALAFVSHDGNTIGGGHNFLGLTDFSDEVTVNKGGIVVGSGFVGIGNGIDGIIIQAGGITQLAGAHDITPPATFRDEVILAGGRLREGVAYAPDADHTFAITDGSIYVAKSGVITAPRTWTIPDGNEGNRLTLLNYSSSAITLHNSGGGSILTAATLPALSGGLNPGVVRLVWVETGVGGAGWAGA